MAKPRGYTRSLASGRVLAQERLVVTVAELVSQALEQRRVSRDELADTLGVPTVELSRRLSGRTEVTLRSLAGMFHALGYRLHLSLIPLADAAPLSGQAPNLPADLAGGTIRASLKGGPGDGQTVHVPVTALEDHGPGPAPVLQVAVVDGHAHVIDTARQEIRAKADVAPLVYVRNISADRGEPVYRYRGRLSPNRARRSRVREGRRA